MSKPLQSAISKIRREITDQLDALENLATSKAKALETAEQRYLELERERDGLNRDQTQLAARVDELKAELANRGTVPRVITADELKAGQCVAVGHDGHWCIIETTFTEEMGGAEILDHFNIYPGDTVVLLEDAPAEEPEPVKVGDTLTTAEELDSLPGGSVVLDHVGDAHQKGGDGEWWETARPEGRDSVDVARYAPFTVLHLPEEDA